MKIKASRHLALMVATGLTGFAICLAIPLPAHAAGSDASAAKSDNATTDKSAQQSSRHVRRHARHSSSKSADRPADKSESKKAAGKDAGSVTSVGMPATVANANAELTSGDGNASPPPASVNPVMAASDKPADAQPDGSVVASDQLNDLDRALQQEQPQPAQPQTAQQEAPASSPPAAVAAPKPAPVLASSDSASLDQTSPIGKIFIGFGALLTVASAARMFMA